MTAKPVTHHLFAYSARLILVLSAGLLLITCKSPVDPLPPATQVGNGTLACLIDGVAWTPRSSDVKSSSRIARYLEKEKTLFVGGGNDKTFQGMHFGLANYTGQVGVYQLDSVCADLPRVCANTGEYTPSKYYEKSVTYQTSGRFKGKVEITKHTASGIVSGTFEFEAQNPVTGKVVKITQGRFDMFYATN
ncbi:MAG: hypothetical protein H7Z72_24890 [Bacteroidetes bacterium]|nr:hypothetical protein [Fibrella sp.]